MGGYRPETQETRQTAHCVRCFFRVEPNAIASCGFAGYFTVPF
jgi:hypothetical protein